MTDPGLLVLCEPTDLAALWAARRLRARMSGPVDVLTASMLVDAVGWDHRLGTEEPSVEIRLADGRGISSTSARPVLNRLVRLPRDRLDAVAGPDSDYAFAEMHALFLSCLHALPGPMLNRPTPQFLAGHWRHPSEWAVMAAQAGLATVRYRHWGEGPPEQSALGPAYRGSTGWGPQPVTVFVVDGRVVAPSLPVPPDVLDGCGHLAKLAGDELVGIEVQQATTGQWQFLRASPVPELRLGGEGLADALAEALRIA